MEFQVQKRNQKIKQTGPKQFKNLTFQSEKNYKTMDSIDSTGAKNQFNNQIYQSSTTFVSGRELNHNSLAIAKEQNQLPVRGKKYWPSRIQNNQVKKTIKYDYKSKNNPTQNSRINNQHISSVGKSENQRYNSVEQQKIFQNRYQYYG